MLVEFNILKNEPRQTFNEKQSKELESFKLLIHYFKTCNTNEEIQRKLGISRQTFNEKQKKFFNLIIHYHPILRKIAKDFTLFFNLSKHIYPQWIVIVKKILIYLNKNISATEYKYKDDIFIIKKGIYNIRHNSSLLSIEIKKSKKEIIEIDVLASKIKADKKDLIDLVTMPLNSEFYFIDGYLSHKVTLKNSVILYIAESKCTDFKKVFLNLKEHYSEQLKKYKIDSYTDFLSHLDFKEENLKEIGGLTSADLETLFNQIETIINAKNVSFFNISFICKYLKDFYSIDIKETKLNSILKIYRVYNFVTNNIFSIQLIPKNKMTFENIVKTAMLDSYVDIKQIILKKLLTKGLALKDDEQLEKHYLKVINSSSTRWKK